MRQLLPRARKDVDPAALYAADERPAPADRPWVVLGMIQSADGAAAVDGRSGGLGGDGDRQVFRAVRGIADAILVGAGTARAERYGMVRCSDEVRAARLERGQAATPRLAIVSGSLDLPADLPLFEADEKPLVVTDGSAPAGMRSVLARRAEIITAGDGTLDLPTALRALRSRGIETLLCEGGPTLNGELLRHGLVDELCVSISPLLVGGSAMRIVHGQDARALDLDLRGVLEQDGLLFLRYARAGVSDASVPSTS